MANEKIGGEAMEQTVLETIKTEAFHVANIHNLLTKTESGENEMFVRKIEKNGFLEGSEWGGRTPFPSLL